ncbi:hypothetical protein [Beduinella massiliensis]|uniref:hypothetical protein n=1 Tax=Beduinella massiliensis TaxID=1852363 RepID=UPI000C83F493
MDKMTIYNAVRAVPAQAQKAIQAGRLKGKTDINPMWRIQVLTELFGPCGDGWGYEIERMWTEEGANGEKCAFVQIGLWYLKEDGLRSSAIPGLGGNMLIAKEKNGPYTSDECFKMALTDAISVAAKALGVGANIYWSAGAQTKYDRPQAPSSPPSNQPAPPAKATPRDNCGELIGNVVYEGKVYTADKWRMSTRRASEMNLCPACMEKYNALNAANAANTVNEDGSR